MLQLSRTLSILLLVLFSTLPLASSEYRYVLLGRAINVQGQPVSFAYFVVSPGPSNKGGDFMYSGEADAEGRIRLEITDSDLAETTRLLSVTGPLPLNAITPIKPPFDEFCWLTEPVYASHQIQIKKNGEVDISNIPVKIFYSTIKVSLQDRFGEPLLKDAIAWRSVALRIRDSQGHFLAETNISREQIERAVNITESSVTLALPKGSWRVEVSLGEDTSWLISDTPLLVDGLSDQLQMILRQQ